MDTLSRILYLHPMQAALDSRCQLRAPWRIYNDAASEGIAPYHLIVEGNCRMDIPDNETFTLQAGDMLMFPRGTPHCLYTSSTEAALPIQQCAAPKVITLMTTNGTGPMTDILCGQFHFNTMAANTLMASLPDVVQVRTTGSPDFIGLHALAMMLRDETAQDRPGGHAVISHLASSLFSLLIRAWLEQNPSVPGLFALLAEPRLSAALQVMLEEPEKPWSVEQLAQTCHMSRATFARLFNTVADATPGDILLRTRMAQAAYYLERDKRSVAEIGEAVGYQSEAAFNRAFKRCIGIGPGQYRSRKYS
jgi:AraC family transcriptional activator of mtrCDE